MKPVKVDRSLNARAEAIIARVNGTEKKKPKYSDAEVNKRVNFMVLTYGASQRLADNLRKQEPADFWDAVATEIEARIPA